VTALDLVRSASRHILVVNDNAMIEFEVTLKTSQGDQVAHLSLCRFCNLPIGRVTTLWWILVRMTVQRDSAGFGSFCEDKQSRGRTPNVNTKGDIGYDSFVLPGETLLNHPVKDSCSDIENNYMVLAEQSLVLRVHYNPTFFCSPKMRHCEPEED
jgi:hypothetical protein